MSLEELKNHMKTGWQKWASSGSLWARDWSRYHLLPAGVAPQLPASTTAAEALPCTAAQNGPGAHCQQKQPGKGGLSRLCNSLVSSLDRQFWTQRPEDYRFVNSMNYLTDKGLKVCEFLGSKWDSQELRSHQTHTVKYLSVPCKPLGLDVLVLARFTTILPTKWLHYILS